MHNFDIVIIVSRFLKNNFPLRTLNKDIFVLPNFIFLSKKQKSPHNTLPLSQNYPKNEMTFGILSRLSPEKNIHLAINAISTIIETHPEWLIKLTIAGEGSEKDSLIQLIKEQKHSDNFQLTGWIDKKEDYFNSIDALIMCATSESFGITILEAFQYHTPLISSKVDGPAEIIKDGYNGLLFDSNNQEQLINKAESLINNPKLAKQLTDAGYNDLLVKYSDNSAILQLERILERVPKYF